MAQMREPNGKFAKKNSSTATKVAGTTGGQNKNKKKETAKVAVSSSKMVNRFGFCLDASGSMTGLSASLLSCLRGNVDALKMAAETSGQTTSVSTLSFNSQVRVHQVGVDPKFYFDPPYAAFGGTRLNDGIMRMISDLKSIPVAAGTDVSYVVSILTDGVENKSSTTFSAVRSEIAALTATGRWSFVFLCPPGCRRNIEDRYGLPPGNIREWETTVKGLVAAAVSTQAGIGEFYATRSKGETSTSCFYAPEGM